MKEKTVLQSIAVMAEQEPHKICIVEQDNVITYEQHWNAVQFYAQELIQNRIERGTRIAIVAEQTARFLTVVSAIHLAGAVVIPLEKICQRTGLRRLCKDWIAIGWFQQKRHLPMKKHRLLI